MLDECFLEPQEVNHGLKILLPDHVDDSWRSRWEYRVAAYDPGGTTGWCFVVVDKRALQKPELKIVDNVLFWSAGEWTGPESVQAHAGYLLALHWAASAIVIEDFILRTLKGGRDLLAPVRVGERIEQALWSPDGNHTPIIKQQPSLAMTTMTDGRVKMIGAWRPGQPHANDATRHAFTWLQRKKALLQKGKPL